MPTPKPCRRTHHKIGRAIAPTERALTLFDQAGCHTTPKLNIPKNLSMVLLPPARRIQYSENVWQYLRQNYRTIRRPPEATIIRTPGQGPQ
jgi:hypothetical protein